MDRQSRSKHRRAVSRGKPDLNRKTLTWLYVTTQSQVKALKADVIEHRLDLECLTAQVLAADLRGKGVIDPRTRSPFDRTGRRSIFRSFDARAFSD